MNLAMLFAVLLLAGGEWSLIALVALLALALVVSAPLVYVLAVVLHADTELAPATDFRREVNALAGREVLTERQHRVGTWGAAGLSLAFLALGFLWPPAWSIAVGKEAADTAQHGYFVARRRGPNWMHFLTSALATALIASWAGLMHALSPGWVAAGALTFAGGIAMRYQRLAPLAAALLLALPLTGCSLLRSVDRGLEARPMPAEIRAERQAVDLAKQWAKATKACVIARLIGSGLTADLGAAIKSCAKMTGRDLICAPGLPEDDDPVEL